MINVPAEMQAGNDSGLAYAIPSQVTASSDILNQAFSVLTSYSNSIVMMWFVIICFKGIRLSLGLQRISDLKNKQILDPGTKWATMITTLSKRIGITTAIRFAESGLTSIPLTVGYFKPVILVPVGMLAAIPVEQVEAILLHELAHIKRQDYFINIFQCLIEVLFFFNPAIWWMSSHLRAERENCCDDLAIANSSNKIDYVRALITFEEYRIQHPQLSIAFAGSENTLLKRTKRIIYNQNDTLNPMEKFILTSGLVVSGLLNLAFTDGVKEQISKTFKPVVSTISKAFPTVEKAFAPFADTIPASSIHEISINNGGLTTFKALHKGKAYKIVMKDDEVTELYVDATKIAEEKLNDYTNEIIEIVQFNDAVKLSGTSERKTFQQGAFTAFKKFDTPKIAVSFGAEPIRLASVVGFDKEKVGKRFAAFNNFSEQAAFSALVDTVVPATPAVPVAPASPPASPTPPVPATPPIPPLAPLAEVKPLRAIKAKPAEISKLKPLKPIIIEVAPAVEIRQTPAIKPVIRITSKVSPAIEVHETPAVKPVIRISPKVVPAEEIREKSKPAAEGGSPMGYSHIFNGSGSISYAPNSNLHRNNNTNDFTNQVNGELVAQGLVKDPKKFSYKINNNELIVDGVKQSDEAHNRVISKVLKNKNQNIEFIYKKN
ncbi:M56 family metallopeptidase [Daejeonella sp.]|uniref:M56 family metallopeptidase n=1 Tax=Daejeonella sp. TaxID=2805397 RepID=UPI0030BB99C7